MGECKFFSMLRPPFQRLVDSTKLTNTNSQSDSMSNSIIFLSPTSSGEDIKAESVMDSSDYTRVEPMSSLNRCEDIEERTERKTGYLMSREQKDILANMKEEDGERQSVKMEGEDGVRDEEELWKKEEKESDEQREGHFIQIFKCENNEGESEFRQQEGVDLSALVTSCLLMQPRVLIHRLEIADISLPVSSSPHPMAYKRDMGARSPWRRHELSPLRGNGSLRQKKGQPVTWKRKRIGQLERPLKLQTSSSENGIFTEASLCSPITPSRNKDTEQTVEVASQVFACSQCPFVDTEEVNLHQHIETVHPEELNGTGDGADNPLPPSSKHQHPKPPDTAPTPKPSHTGTPTAHTCSQCGKSFPQLATLPSMGECKFFSMPRPPFQRVVDSTKLTNTNSQSDSMSNSSIFLSPASSGEDIKAESVMDSSDYTGVEPRSSVNRFEDIVENIERKTGYVMSREQKDILTNMKEEEEDGERQSVKMEGEDGVRDEEELWKEQEKERDEQREEHVPSQAIKIYKWDVNGQQEGEELFTLVTSCLLKQPRVQIHRLEFADILVPVSSAPGSVACKTGQGARSPWRRHELLSLRGNGSLRQKKGQVMTWKWKTNGQLERSPKMLPSENGIFAETSLISPAISPRNQNTGQTGEVASQVFACSQCPFVHTEEVNLHQHIEKVHPEEHSRALRAGMQWENEAGPGE
ncbi:hypothetical protein SKAU_G00182810 [Synaphobranchus kaupii]|uniref:C2H2-type domain-containing protein n=1 Tax=Synaphobranchus kaupii TaxID=118154 RepID=A0A9Q1FC44_SYNKA|nr:hypothetical protein SKAU_G00182810 [Synaphobranchus kaupii]